jgi:catechol 2,3-dioxygenase-like lactoylglutathione lyase family enzyme
MHETGKETNMTLPLYMVGLAVTDMDRSLEFYRRLGLAVPQESEGQPHIEVKMQGELTLFLDTRTIPREHPAGGEAAEQPRVIFEYNLKSQAAVEAKDAELIGYGYQSYRSPFIFSNGMCFALVDDPDGHTILLSGDVKRKPS